MSAELLPFAAADPPGPACWVFLAVQLALPLLAWRSRRALEAGEDLPGPGRLLPMIVVQQLVLLALGLAAAWDGGVELRRGLPGPTDWAIAAAALALMLGSAPLVFRITPREERRRRAALLPRTPAQVRWWLLVCLVTGPTEEISWRAVLPALGARLGLAPLAAVGLSALLFALAHMVQGRLAAAIVLLIAALFHGLVALSGSLVTAIAVHALYDAIVTVWLAPRLHRAVDGPAG